MIPTEGCETRKMLSKPIPTSRSINVNLGETKDMTLGKGLVPFREGFIQWEHMGKIQEVGARKPRVYEKRRSLENYSLLFGSFCDIF